MYRYILERKEPYTYFTGPGRPVPVHTYRWKGIMLSNDRKALEDEIPAGKEHNYQIVDRYEGV